VFSDTPDAKSTWISELNDTLTNLSDLHYQPKMTLNSCHGNDSVIRDLCYWLFYENPNPIIPVAQPVPSLCLTPVIGPGVVGISNITNSKVFGPIFPDLAPVAPPSNDRLAECSTAAGNANQAECKQQ